MKTSSRTQGQRGPIAAVALVAAAALLMMNTAGCGSNQGVNSAATFDAGSLDEVGELYRSAASRLGKPPGSLKDLAGGKEMFLLGYDSVARGDVIVYWGVKPLPGDQATEEILGYKSTVPTGGGPVLLSNTTLKTMTADQFQAAAKPPGKTSK